MSSSSLPPEIFEHSYAIPKKAEESASDNSSTKKAEESASDNSSTKTDNSNSKTSSPSPSEPDDVTKPRARLPPERHIDSYYVSSTPKSSPGNALKRLSSTSRKAKVVARSFGGSYPSLLKMRLSSCGNCEGCVREDCGKCVFCKDKVKFGGPGKKKQRCLLRACINMPMKKGAAEKLVINIRLAMLIRPDKVNYLVLRPFSSK